MISGEANWELERVGVKGSREEGGDFAVSTSPQCGAHAEKDCLSNRCFTSQDLPVKEVTSSPAKSWP